MPQAFPRFVQMNGHLRGGHGGDFRNALQRQPDAVNQGNDHSLLKGEYLDQGDPRYDRAPLDRRRALPNCSVSTAEQPVGKRSARRIRGGATPQVLEDIQTGCLRRLMRLDER